MAKRISPTVIGAFVVCSLAILAIAIVVVGSGRMFRTPIHFVCMFQGNLNGLKVGAPVKVRGVQIGTVAAIKLRLSPAEGTIRPGVTEPRLPVFLEIDQSQLLAQGATGAALEPGAFATLLKRGLRAQLTVESILTGLMYVDLDFHPAAPLDLILVPGSGPYREIPTVPTTMEAIEGEATKALKRFEQIDFQALTVALTNAATSIQDLASSPDIKATLESLRDATTNLSQTLTLVRATVNNANGTLSPLAGRLQDNSRELSLTLKQTRVLLATMQSMVGPGAPLAVRLTDTLEQLSQAAQSLGQLADYLQQNPSTLIRGRYVPKKER